MLIIFGLLISVLTKADQTKTGGDTLALNGDDLHYFGYVMLSGDTSVWPYIVENDMYYLSKGIFHRSVDTLEYIVSDDLFYFGKALVVGDREELEKVLNDDLYYLGYGIFERSVGYLENVRSEDVYQLGKALIERNMNRLDQISTDKRE